METILKNAPLHCTCFCGGCTSVEEQGQLLNENWCHKVNQELLIPAGYHCKAHSWITYTDKHQPVEHMQLRILKGVPGVAIPIAATIVRDVPTVAIPIAATATAI
jgi:hypothetical protein